MTIRNGSVYLIGAGPGDAGLITVRGLEILQRADVVIHDRLIDRSLLESVRPDAEIVDAGKAPEHHTLDQPTIESIILDRAAAGRAVVRLKGGDPFVFGRGFEELEACATRGIPCEVVPGVSSMIAAPAAAEIPLTLRGVARGFAVVSGHGSRGEHLCREVLAPYASAETLVVLMGVRALPVLVGLLLEMGRPHDTPIAIVERAWMAGQTTVRGTLSSIVELTQLEQIESPAVIIVGPVVDARDRLQRLDLPLQGARVAVTRPTSAASELIAHLRHLGAEVVQAPLIQIHAKQPDPGWVDQLQGLSWIVVSSRHGARGFWRSLRAAGLDARSLAGARIAAVGPITARELEACGLAVDLIPPVHRASSLIDELGERFHEGARALFACGSLARRELPDGLRGVGYTVHEVEVYQTRTVAPDRRTRMQFNRGLDTVLFASPSAVHSYRKSLLESPVGSFVCIGPTTAHAARRAGLSPIVIAPEHSDAGLVRATLNLRLQASSETTQ